MLFSDASALSVPSSFESSSLCVIYRQALLTNVLNPKVAIFFLAFVPQFIAADSPNKFLAFVALGLSFVTTGTIWCFCLAWFASLLSEGLRASARLARVLNRTAGALFIFLGIRLAAAR